MKTLNYSHEVHIVTVWAFMIKCAFIEITKCWFKFKSFRLEIDLMESPNSIAMNLEIAQEMLDNEFPLVN